MVKEISVGMKFLFIILIFTKLLISSDARAVFLAKKLNLSAGSKAVIQWERIFNSERKMKRYKIDQLNEKDRNLLKEYLINHAIDSDQPTIAGV